MEVIQLIHVLLLLTLEPCPELANLVVKNNKFSEQTKKVLIQNLLFNFYNLLFINLKLTFINFQTKKQKLAVKEKQDNELKERLSLCIPLVDEIEEDVKIAKLLSYKTSDSKY